ncbi:hypothetical protein QYF61_026755 [Mycteria americana]|uniref:Uncharacterized protein n=1 Tax=Mycteria americana TaxID=33587 RepID=A0AAN7RYG1_MYCAM|nr:hypothetical protein QYF61_026755 [Mycteria americana]
MPLRAQRRILLADRPEVRAGLTGASEGSSGPSERKWCLVPETKHRHPHSKNINTVIDTGWQSRRITTSPQAYKHSFSPDIKDQFVLLPSQETKNMVAEVATSTAHYHSMIHATLEHQAFRANIRIPNARSKVHKQPTGKQLCKEGLGFLVDTKLNTSHQFAIAAEAHRILGCIGSVASRPSEVILPLCSTVAAFQPLFPKPVALHGVVVAQVQDLALSLVEPHTIGLGPSIQPVQIPLQSLPTLKQINTPTQFGVVCKLTEGALDPLIQIIDKDIKQNWPQHRALGNTACDRPPTGFKSIHHHSLGLAIQPVFYPAKSTPVQAMSSQFLQENAVGNDGWRLNHFPGQSVPMLDNPLGEEKFPNIQSKPPLAQLEAISSCPITCYLGEETDPHLSTTSFQVVVESDEVSPQPPFLQAKQSQLPQPLLIRLLLQTLHQLRCPSLYALQYLNIPLVVGGPKLNTVFEVRPHQCRVQGHNHFPSPAGHAIFDTGQDAIGLLGRLGTLLAHIQAAVNQHPQVLLCQAAFQPLFPKPVALHGVAVAQVQDLALGLVKPHTIHPSPSIQPVQVPLQSLPTLQQINTPTQLGVVCKLTESALDPFVQIIDKDVKQNWPQHRALGNTACDRPPTGVNSIHHHSLGPAVQPVLYPAKSTPVQAMSSQFLQENAVGNRVKGFTEV